MITKPTPSSNGNAAPGGKPGLLKGLEIGVGLLCHGIFLRFLKCCFPFGSVLITLNRNDDLPWPRDIHEFVETLRAAGITEFAVTDRSTGLMEGLHLLAAEGCTMQGLCKVTRRDLDLRQFALSVLLPKGTQVTAQFSLKSCHC